MTNTAPLDRYLAEHDIRKLGYRYARGSDRLDAEMFASAFWEDGAFNQPSDVPTSVFAEQLVGIMGRYFAVTHHLNGNILIDFNDHDHAASETYFRAYHLTKQDLTNDDATFIIGERRMTELGHSAGAIYDITVGGRYLDQVERRNGVWRIKLRRLVFDYCDIRKSEGLRPGEGMTAMGAAAMARSKKDPSYAI